MTSPFIQPFLSARPVWAAGRAEVMNDYLLFRGSFNAVADEEFILRLTGSTTYRVRFNGEFLASGPARGPRNVFRVDEMTLTAQPGENLVEIEISGCNVNSYFYMDHPSFLQAEVCRGGEAVLWTGRDFTAWDLSPRRIRKSPRFSFQRMFTENYRLSAAPETLTQLELEERPDVLMMPRTVPQPEYRIDTSYKPVKQLRRRYDASRELPVTIYVDNIGVNGFKGYPRPELELDSCTETQRYVRDDNGPILTTLFQGNVNNSGFLKLKVRCTRPGRLISFFSEIEEPEGGLNPLRLTSICSFFWELTEPGIYELETLEPYTFKFVETFMESGEAEVLEVSMREFKSPLVNWEPPETDDEPLKTIYQAGCETFAANAVDCFTDCPSRERGGWLCDSFFIGRTSLMLTGSTMLERFFLENFAYTDTFEPLPEGAFPMLFPSDNPDRVFIPNWGMWLIIELEEYLQRSGDRELIDAFRNKVLDFIRYIDTFLNEDGLLEKLPSWVFIEWSKANDFVQDVNYPSNMTYAAVLEVVARLYDLPELNARAEKMRGVIRAQSWNGSWFCDHAIRREDGSLQVMKNDVTETCQYYAFFFGTATPESHPQLWKRLLEDFGPQRRKTGLWKEIWPSNAFIGNYLRLELLSINGLHSQVLNECKGYFKKMADRTGTLWEHDSTTASCCHGFASYVNVLIRKYLEG